MEALKLRFKSDKYTVLNIYTSKYEFKFFYTHCLLVAEHI